MRCKTICIHHLGVKIFKHYIKNVFEMYCNKNSVAFIEFNINKNNYEIQYPKHTVTDSNSQFPRGKQYGNQYKISIKFQKVELFLFRSITPPNTNSSLGSTLSINCISLLFSRVSPLGRSRPIWLNKLAPYTSSSAVINFISLSVMCECSTFLCN